jgi:hypothetical protein
MKFNAKLIFERADDEVFGACDNPGRIILVVEDRVEKNLLVLLDKKWDAQEVFDWFMFNKGKILNDSLPDFIIGDGSIPEKLEEFYDKADLIPEGYESESDAELWDKIYSYRESHSLRFAFKGCDVEDIYIGKSNIGHEVSCVAAGGNWSYPIDIEDFYQSIYVSGLGFGLQVRCGAASHIK